MKSRAIVELEKTNGDYRLILTAISRKFFDVFPKDNDGYAIAKMTVHCIYTPFANKYSRVKPRELSGNEVE